MSDQDIFEENSNSQETPETTAAPNTGDLFSDQLSQITDVDGRQKYDDVNKALEALKASQEYIPTLKEENEKLKQELEKRESVEDVVKRLQGNQTTEETTKVQSLDEEAVQSLVNNVLSQREAQSVEAQNMLLVTQSLTQKYGEKAKEVISSKANELGTTPNDLKEMARKQPKVFLALFGQSTSGVSTNPTTSSTQSTISKEQSLKPETPKKSVLAGARTEDLVSEWRKDRDYIYKEFNIES